MISHRRRRIQSTSARFVRAAALAAMLSTAGCSTPRESATVAAENIAAQPPGTVAAVIGVPTSRLPEALRALGIPFRKIEPTALSEIEKSTWRVVIIDEMATTDPAVKQSFPGMVELTRRRGTHLVVLHQGTVQLQEIAVGSSSPLRARDVRYAVGIVAPNPLESALTVPNRLLPMDIDSLAAHTGQLASGTGGRAILAGNLDRPDSSATLLEVPLGSGRLHYVAGIIVDRAAEGYAAEQRLLANLLSR